MGTEQCAVVVFLKLKLWSKSVSMKFFCDGVPLDRGNTESRQGRGGGGGGGGGGLGTWGGGGGGGTRLATPDT